jgi:hypothetical protein
MSRRLPSVDSPRAMSSARSAPTVSFDTEITAPSSATAKPPGPISTPSISRYSSSSAASACFVSPAQHAQLAP